MLLFIALLVCAVSADHAPFLSLRQTGALLASGSDLQYKAEYHHSQRHSRWGHKRVWIDEIHTRSEGALWNWVDTDSQIVAKHIVARTHFWPLTDCSTKNSTAICAKAFPSSETEKNSLWPEEALAGKAINGLRKTWKWVRKQLRITSKPFPRADLKEERTVVEDDDELKTKPSSSTASWNGENEISSPKSLSERKTTQVADWHENEIVSRVAELAQSLWFGEKDICGKSAVETEDVAELYFQDGGRLWTKSFSKYLNGWLWEADDALKVRPAAETD